MLTFLRKIRKSLIGSNSTRKYLLYAFGEIFLVMIGILLALQVNNWNERRKNHHLEKKMLIEINREFKENKARFEVCSAQHLMAYNSTKDLIEYFPIQLEKNTLDSVLLKLYESLERHTFNPSQGMIKSLINSSSFDVIRNEELRRLLISWSDWVRDYQEDEIANSNHARTFLIPLIMESLAFGDFYDERNDLQVFTSLKFENAVKTRIFFLSDIAEGEQYELIKNTIDRIIELTNE